MDAHQLERALEQYQALWHTHPEWFKIDPQAAEADGIALLPDTDMMRRACLDYAVWLKKQDLPPGWARPGLVYQDPWLVILRDPVRFPDGHYGLYFRVLHRHPGGIAVLPILEDKIVLIRHFRHAPRQWMWELPRGFSDETGSDPQKDALRELQEEIGVSHVLDLVSLGICHADSGILANRCHIFAARIDHLGPVETEAAIAESRLVDRFTFETMVRDGEITDSFAETAYLRACLFGLL